MQIPNWLKVAYWLLVTVSITIFFVHRYPALVEGRAVPADIVVFLVWVALLLTPIFSEISMFGVTLKQEIKSLRKTVENELVQIRTEIRNSVDVRTSVNPQFHFGPIPVADANLPNLKADILETISSALETHGIKKPTSTNELPAVSDDVSFLFSTRYALEKEVRRLARARELEQRAPVTAVLRLLAANEVLEPGLAQAVREVYAVCSPAIHGEPVTAAKVDFVRTIGPNLIKALQAVI